VAYSVNGFGTTYYGQRAFERDGSYITTKWAIAGTLPLVPLDSIRVKEIRSGFSGRQKVIVDEMGIDWPQVLLTYVYVYLLVPFALYLIIMPNQRSFIDDYQVPFAVVMLVKTFPLLFVIALPHLLRWWSRREAKAARR
jgi:hypothetical protein